jgi:ankyrin repeat protein
MLRAFLVFLTAASLCAAADSDKPDVNKADIYGMTALHKAVEAGNKEETARLIHLGADVNAVNRYHVAPLSIAALKGNANIVQMLLEAGADANVLMGEGEPVIMTAARSGNAEAVRELISAGADVNARERLYGQSAVMWAAIDNHADVIKVLAENHADIDARANILEGEPMWRYGKDTRTAANGEALQAFDTAFSKGGLTPLLYAARQGSTEAVAMLMDLHANTGLPDGEGYPPLQIAIMNAHYDTAAVMVEKGADVNQTDKNGQTPLYALVDTRTLLWMYNRPSPKAQNKLDTLEFAKILLDHGAKVNARLTGPARRPMGFGGSPLANKGITPFLRAAFVSDLPMMRLLLEHGADPKATTDAGINALQIAAGLRWVDNTMQTAVAQGFGSQEDSIEAIQLLLDKGLDINAVDNQGETAMHGAAFRGADKIVQYLADHGAKLDVRTKPYKIAANAVRGEGEKTLPGRTPLEEALIADPWRQSTVALLRKMMGIPADAPLPKVETGE